MLQHGAVILSAAIVVLSLLWWLFGSTRRWRQVCAVFSRSYSAKRPSPHSRPSSSSHSHLKGSASGTLKKRAKKAALSRSKSQVNDEGLFRWPEEAKGKDSAEVVEPREEPASAKSNLGRPLPPTSSSSIEASQPAEGCPTEAPGALAEQPRQDPAAGPPAASFPSDSSEWNVVSRKGDAASEGALKSKVARLEEENVHFKNSYSKLSKMYDELKFRADGYEKDKKHLAVVYGKKVESMEGELVALRGSNASLSAEVQKLRLAGIEGSPAQSATIEELTQKLNSLSMVRAENEDLLRRFKTFELVAAEYESSKALLSAANAALESEKLMRRQAENQVAQLETDLGNLKVRSLEEARAVQPPTPDESQEIEALRKASRAAEDGRREALGTIDKLDEQLASLKAALESSMMNEATSALGKEAAVSQSLLLSQQLDEARKESAAAQGELVALKEKLKGEHDRFTSEMELTAHAMTAFKQRIRDNEAQLCKLRSELDSSTPVSIASSSPN